MPLCQTRPNLRQDFKTWLATATPEEILVLLDELVHRMERDGLIGGAAVMEARDRLRKSIEREARCSGS